jgi:hypothetical protein
MSDLLQILECSCASIGLPLVLNHHLFIWGRWMYWWQSLTTLLVWACSLGAYFASGALLQSATHIEWTYVEWNYEQFWTATWESDVLSSSTEVTLNPSLYLCAVISAMLTVRFWVSRYERTQLTPLLADNFTIIPFQGRLCGVAVFMPVSQIFLVLWFYWCTHNMDHCTEISAISLLG